MTDHRLSPWARAVIADGHVTLNAWTPSLITGGPASMMLERLAVLGVALADLSAVGDPGDEDLFVTYLGRSRTDAADAALHRWAHTVGYRRVWFPDAVFDLEPSTAPTGLAQVTCPTCGLEWRDDTAAFWRQVRDCGAFPASCQACGGSLPEWKPVATVERHQGMPAKPPR